MPTREVEGQTTGTSGHKVLITWEDSHPGFKTWTQGVLGRLESTQPSQVTLRTIKLLKMCYIYVFKNLKNEKWFSIDLEFKGLALCFNSFLVNFSSRRWPHRIHLGSFVCTHLNLHVNMFDCTHYTSHAWILVWKWCVMRPFLCQDFHLSRCETITYLTLQRDADTTAASNGSQDQNPSTAFFFFFFFFCSLYGPQNCNLKRSNVLLNK